MKCECGAWEFRDIAVATGLAVIERACPRCRRQMLLVFRGPEHVATVELGGRHTERLEASLRAAGLAAGEIALLMTAAALMAVS